ncbi:MAG: flagellar basal body rod protein FlgB [Candidatus Sericytochromatia bacterium]|nr:flagellar basal body rod protein FlgB [Candidatus Sericytochromatia bacterium]
MHLTSLTMTAVERSLDGLAARQAAVAHNVANIATPGYIRREVNFEESLREALDAAHQPQGLGYDLLNAHGAPVTESHNNPLLTWQPVTTLSADGPQRLDGNTVAVEKEIMSMVANKYNALAAVISKDFQLLRTIAQAR